MIFSLLASTSVVLNPGGIITAAYWSHVKLARALPIMRNPQNSPYDYPAMLRK